MPTKPALEPVQITPRSVRAAVGSGLAWAIVWALTLPLAVGLMLLLGDAADGAGSGGLATGTKKPRTHAEHRALQYWVTAATVALVYVVVALVTVFYVRHRNGV